MGLLPLTFRKPSAAKGPQEDEQGFLISIPAQDSGGNAPMHPTLCPQLSLGPGPDGQWAPRCRPPLPLSPQTSASPRPACPLWKLHPVAFEGCSLCPHTCTPSSTLCLLGIHPAGSLGSTAYAPPMRRACVSQAQAQPMPPRNPSLSSPHPPARSPPSVPSSLLPAWPARDTLSPGMHGYTPVPTGCGQGPTVLFLLPQTSDKPSPFL